MRGSIYQIPEIAIGDPNSIFIHFSPAAGKFKFYGLKICEYILMPSCIVCSFRHYKSRHLR
jgi:hypothetical protein